MVNKLSIRNFYQQQTPTYSVEYVLENYGNLDNRDFYVEEWALSHSYQEWRDDTNWDRRKGWVEMCDVNYGSIVTILATAKRDSETGKILEKYGIWTGAGNVLDTIMCSEDGKIIKVGPISRYHLENSYVRFDFTQNSN